jgi:AcrR family transcriptional regulator
MKPPAELPSSRRERERGEMRRMITDAARRLFVSEGYESTTIRRIAEAIEYTPGAIYSYFKDKDAILYALHQEGFIELQRRFAAAIEAGQNPIEQLERVGQAYVAFAKANPEMYHLMFVAQATSRTLNAADAWPEGKVAYDSMRDVVHAAVRDGWIRSGDPEVIAFLLWATAHGAVTLEICDRCMILPDSHRNDMAERAFACLLGTLMLPRSEPHLEPKAEIEPRRRKSPPES